MRPFDAILDEALDELRRGDRAAFARADILHVGDRRIDQAVERLRRAACATTCRPLSSPACCSLPARSSLFENSPAHSWPRLIRIAPGQRREVDDRRRLVVALHVGDRVGEDEPPFGVGVDHFDRLAGHGRDDVARALGVAVGHVLDEPADADDVGLGLAQGERLHRADDRAGAAHVPLHRFHAGGRLDRDAAGVEGHALADEGDRLRPSPPPFQRGPAAAPRGPSPGRRREARPCRASPSPRGRAPRSRRRCLRATRGRARRSFRDR